MDKDYRACEQRGKIIELKKKGNKTSDISGITGLTPQHVNRVWKDFKTNGDSCLKQRTRGRPSGVGMVLTLKQQRDILDRLLEHPTQKSECGEEAILWGKDELKVAVEEVLGAKIPQSTLNDYMKRWGFPKNNNPLALFLSHLQKETVELISKYIDAEVQKMKVKDTACQKILWLFQERLKHGNDDGSPQGLHSNSQSYRILAVLDNRKSCKFLVFKNWIETGDYNFFLRLCPGATKASAFLWPIPI